ncbi:MAG: mechanosensitive ion channel family protein [Myxococcota bacterium]
MRISINDLIVMSVELVSLLLFVVVLRTLALRTLRRFAGRLSGNAASALVPLSAFVRRGALLLAPTLLGITLMLNVWILYQGESLLGFALTRLGHFTRENAIAAGLLVGKCAGWGLMAALVNSALKWAITWLEHRVLEYRQQVQLPAVEIPIRTPDERAGESSLIASSCNRLRSLVKRSLQAGVLVACLATLGAPLPVQEASVALARIYPLVALPFALAPAFGLLAEQGVIFLRRHLEARGVQRYFDVLLPLAMLSRRLVGLVLSLGLCGLALLQFESTVALAVIVGVTMEVLLTVLAARLVAELVEPLLREHFSERAHLSELERNRRQTLLPIFRGLLQSFIGLSTVMILLIEVGIDPLPIVAGAGVVGMALGLGARELIGDIVGGFFMLVEDQVTVGDLIAVNGVEGQVLAIHFRTLWIRQSSGALHILNNGDIRKLTNLSRANIQAYIEARVAYHTDLEVLKEAVQQLEVWAREHLPEVTGPVRLRGVKAYDDSALEVQVTALCQPGQHQRMTYPLRTRLFEILRERGIEIPYPRMVVLHDGSARGSVPYLGEPSIPEAPVTPALLPSMRQVGGDEIPAQADGFPLAIEKEARPGLLGWLRAWF